MVPLGVVVGDEVADRVREVEAEVVGEWLGVEDGVVVGEVVAVHVREALWVAVVVGETRKVLGRVQRTGAYELTTFSIPLAAQQTAFELNCGSDLALISHGGDSLHKSTGGRG